MAAFVLLCGGPKGGTPLELAAPATAIDPRLRVFVQNDAKGRTQVSFHPVMPMLLTSGAPEALAKGLEQAQARCSARFSPYLQSASKVFKRLR